MYNQIDIIILLVRLHVTNIHFLLLSKIFLPPCEIFLYISSAHPSVMFFHPPIRSMQYSYTPSLILFLGLI